MITWDLFKSQDDLYGYLKESGATLREEEREVSFPCWGFTFAYFDESTGLEIVTKKDLERMLEAVSG